MEDMGAKIKRLRTDMGMTLEALGEKVGVGKSTVRKWENGMIENMKRDKIAKVANALNVSPAYLMGWDEEEKDNSYYLDPDAAQIAQEVFERPQMKVLFDAGRKVSAEDLDLVINMLDRMKKAETHEDEE